MAHTILLMQTDQNPGSMQYSNHDSLENCLMAVAKIYGKVRMMEREEKGLDPDTDISYDICELFEFIDNGLVDLSCLVFVAPMGCYEPHGKDWIKEKIYAMVKKI